MSKIAVAIVGNGGIFRLAHAPAWGQIPRARVAATCDIITERAEQACHELAADRYFTSFEDLLANDGIDAVDICTPHPTHADLTLMALQAGKHVLCEKPMAMTVKEGRQMMEAAKAAGRHLYIGHTRRFDRRWLYVKEQLAAGRIGDPVCLRWTERSWAGFSKDSWRWDPRNGGVLADLGVHVIDLFSWFLDAAPTEVYAKALSIREEARKSGCYDFGIIELGFPAGRQGLVELSYAHPKEFAPFYSSLEIVGTKGKISLSDREASPMTVVKEEIHVPRYSPLLSTFVESFVSEIDDFLDCITGKTSPRITPEEAHGAVRGMCAALESAVSGQPVPLSAGSWI